MKRKGSEPGLERTSTEGSYSRETITQAQDRILRELESLTENPELMQERISSSIETATTEMEFTDSAFDARAEVALVTGQLGETEVTPEDIDEAKTLREISRNALERIRQMDVRQLASSSVEGIKKFLRENWVSLTPLLIMPASLATGGAAGAALQASAELTVAMFALDKVLDQMIEDAEVILPPQFLVPFMAATTNLAEMGASQMSAVVGDPISEVAATPLGSNPMNVLLTGLALSTAVGERKITMYLESQGIDPNDEKARSEVKKEMLDDIGFADVMKQIDWKGLSQQVGMAGVAAISALMFRYAVAPEMKKGNLIPLMGWLGVNLPVMAGYFYKTTFSKKSQIGNVLENIGTHHIETMREELLDEDVYEQGTAPLIEMLSAIELLKQHDEMEFASKKEKKEHHKEIMALVIEKLSEIQETIEDSPEFQAHVHELLKRADMKDLQVLFKTGKIKTGEDEPIDKVRAARLIAGVGGISFLSWRMDKAISLMPTAIPGLSKGAAGFFIMSFFSSAGEFLVSKKYMERGADEDAGKNITDSNAINIGLAQAAMATSAARSGMAFI